MRPVLAILLVACAAPRPFVPARVYVVEPCVRETMTGGQHCESPSVEPALDCGERVTEQFDGCHWQCGPWFQPNAAPMQARKLTVNGVGVGEALLTTNLCAPQNYCEGK